MGELVQELVAQIVAAVMLNQQHVVIVLVGVRADARDLVLKDAVTDAKDAVVVAQVYVFQLVLMVVVTAVKPYVILDVLQGV